MRQRQGGSPSGRRRSAAARVLVVDDNRDLADGIAMLLGEAECLPQVAYCAEDAVRLLESGEYALVLSDIRMPGMSGLELLDLIRERWPLTRVLLLTAYGSIESAVAAMKFGALDYLTKPFDNQELVRVVCRALHEGVGAGGLDTSAVVGEVATAVSSDDLLSGLKRALEVLLQASGADDGEIFLCEPEGKDALLCAWAGADAAALTERVRFGSGSGHPGMVTATGTPLCRRGNLASDRLFLRRCLTDAGIRSSVGAPMVNASGVLGSIHLMSRRDDFPVEWVLDLLQRTAIPIGNAARSWLAGLRQTVDRIPGDLGGPAAEQSLRALLDLMRETVCARSATLTLINPPTGLEDQTVSSGQVSLICRHAEHGSWTQCPSIAAAHGFVANPGRRRWPERCRTGLPPRAASPCCVPLMVASHLYGIALFDYGRVGNENAVGRLVPLLTIAHQAAIRVQARYAAMEPGQAVGGRGANQAVSTAPELELRCLGPFSISLRGHAISSAAFKRHKSVDLLKLLVLKAGTPLHRDDLIEHLWPEADPDSGANRLHGVVHDLRAVIEPRREEREWLYVLNRGDFYLFDMDAPLDLDLIQYRRCVAQGLRESLSAADAIRILEEAIALYRGDLFADDPAAAWCAGEREQARALQVRALVRLSQLHARQGVREATIDYLRRALSLSPFREDLLLAQMKLLARYSRNKEALAVCEDHRRLLQERFDAPLSPRILACEQDLLRLSADA